MKIVRDIQKHLPDWRPTQWFTAERRGSTLVIVIALLGLLAFTGMVFYIFAAQERAAAEYFSEAAKDSYDEPDDVFDWMLEHVIRGPDNRYKTSILWERNRRHSLVSGLVGRDIYPHNGEGIRLAYSSAGLPIVDMDGDGTADTGAGIQDWLEFVDSPAARNGSEERTATRPDPDVDYTYPDINNLFLAYRGWAIRDNGGGTPRFEQVPVIIPSYFRPQYMKSGNSNGNGGANTPTDVNWAEAFDGTDRTSAPFLARSFRPHPRHLAGISDNGNRIFRYLTEAEATSLGVTSGGFPFVPEDDTNSANQTAARGELGIWTGSDPNVYELDADNDGDNIREGIWLDLNYPVQEIVDSSGTTRMYVVLHSVTIYDLDSLIDVNVHGNLAGLSRNGDFTALLPEFQQAHLSRSNLGLGANEVSPLWAMRRDTSGGFTTNQEDQFNGNYGRIPNSTVEAANMEWLWLMAGRGQYDAAGDLEDLYAGRWGDLDLRYNSLSTHAVQDLPRPGRTERTGQSASGIGFGGRGGFDDNFDSLEGEPLPRRGVLRAFGHPLDYSGRGLMTATDYPVFNPANGRFTYNLGGSDVVGTDNPLLPFLYDGGSTTDPLRWVGYRGYSVSSEMNNSAPARFMFGRDGAWNNGTGDDQIGLPFEDALFEDPLETIFDPELAIRPEDEVFGPEDLLAMHLEALDLSGSIDDIGTRVQDLAPFTFAAASDVRDRFTTLSNSLRRFALQGREPGQSRGWEFSADSDGADRDGNGFGDGDGILEFPPQFGTVIPYSKADPFRPQVRRLLTVEFGENGELLGQLPLSINHLLDVNRDQRTPQEGTPEFLYYMQRSGMRFRNLTPHPEASETDVLTLTDLPDYDGNDPARDTLPVYPPTTVAEREFWAQRDRQQLARDIYVLLYTIGGATVDNSSGDIVNHTADIAATNPNAYYSEERLEQMAQFAVNLVDALDRDNVMTQFEYDTNLGDGWNLDDFASTVEGTADRQIVFGVEAQQMAFSEVLGVYSEEFQGNQNDAPETAHNDTAGDHLWLHVELQNMLPQLVELATTATGTSNEERSIWRLQRRDRSNANQAHTVGQQNGPTLSLMEGNDPVAPGQTFTIGMAALDGSPANSNPTGWSSSDLYADDNSDGNFNRVSPAVGNTTIAAGDPTPAPSFDLDVLHSDHNSRWLMSGNTTQAGQFLEGTGGVTYPGNDEYGFPSTRPGRGNNGNSGNGNNGNGNGNNGNNGNQGNPNTAQKGFDLVLQRRLNPNMPSLSLAENPFVEVDRFGVTFEELFDLNPGNNGNGNGNGNNNAQPQLQLADLESVERVEPLAALSFDDYNPTQDPNSQNYRRNTIGGERNSVLYQEKTGNDPEFDLWQPHFDRDFASPAELLQLPVVGPRLLTSRLDRMRSAPYQQTLNVQRFDDANATDQSGPVGIADADITNLASAAGLFLQPDFPDGSATGGGGSQNNEESLLDNRWYRLFSFVEVPSRIHRMLGNYLTLDRVPGKVNLNTVRHFEVYAGIIDHPMFADMVDTDDDRATGPFLTESTPGVDGSGVALTTAGGHRTGVDGDDRWMKFIHERDGATISGWDPAASGGSGAAREFWLPGTPNAKPFRSAGHTNRQGGDNGIEDTIFRGLSADEGTADANRHWLEVGNLASHRMSGTTGVQGEIARQSTAMQRHQILAKLMNNTTTVSNTFIVYSTAAYFEAVEDPATGLIRVGGRFDLDEDGDAENDQQRAVFIIDRTEAFNGYDAGTGDFEWERLVKHRARLE